MTKLDFHIENNLWTLWEVYHCISISFPILSCSSQQYFLNVFFSRKKHNIKLIDLGSTFIEYSKMVLTAL